MRVMAVTMAVQAVQAMPAVAMYLNWWCKGTYGVYGGRCALSRSNPKGRIAAVPWAPSPVSVHFHAAVDIDRLAGDQRVLVGCDEDRRGGDLLRLGDPFEGYFLH